MFYNLDIKKDKDLLCVALSGSRTRESISAAAKEIVNACRQHQADKVMIDVRRLTGRIPIFDSLSVIFNDFPAIRATGVINKAAFIESEIRRTRFTFFERVAHSRGYNIRFFIDPDAALKWLGAD